MQWRDKKCMILFFLEITICFPEVLFQEKFIVWFLKHKTFLGV